MIDKVAHDAFSQGAYDALQAMDVPQHIKVAAAQHLTKEAFRAGTQYSLKKLLGAGAGATGLTLAGKALLSGKEEPRVPSLPPEVVQEMMDNTPAPPPPPAPELGMMDQLGNYGSDLLDRARAGELSNSELAALASAGVLGTGALAYGLS